MAHMDQISHTNTQDLTRETETIGPMETVLLALLALWN